MKRILFALTLAAAVMAGCQKIDDLETRVDALEATVTQIQSLINNGYVVTSYTQTSTGWALNLSNGYGSKTLEIVNGTDGRDGVDGKNGTDGSNGDTIIGSIAAKDGCLVLTLADGQVFTLPLQPSTVGQISSLVIIPADDSNTVYAEGYAGAEWTATVECVISPASAAAALAKDNSGVTVKALFYQVATKASTPVEIEGKISSVEGSSLIAEFDCQTVADKTGSKMVGISLSDKTGAEIMSSLVGFDKKFQTLSYGGVEYNIVKMKDGRTWMADNLRYIPEGMTVSASDFSANTGIWYPVVTKGDKDVEASTGESVIAAQGYFYSPAVAFANSSLTWALNVDQTANQGICPDGWHIPTNAEIIALVGKCNDKTLTDESAPYYNATDQRCNLKDLNTDGFNLYPYSYVNNGASYGNRVLNTAGVEDFRGMNSMGYIYSSTGRSATQCYAIMVSNVAASTTAVSAYMNLTFGAQVRCIKNR